MGAQVTALWAILTGNPIARALAKVLALVLAVMTFGAWQRRQGAAKARQRQAEATVKGIQRGAEGAADAAADIKAGKTPQEVKNANDAAWR